MKTLKSEEKQAKTRGEFTLKILQLQWIKIMILWSLPESLSQPHSIHQFQRQKTTAILAQNRQRTEFRAGKAAGNLRAEILEVRECHEG